MSDSEKTKEQLLDCIRDLEIRLQESEDTLEAIRTGAVDALVVSDGEGEKIFTLQGIDHSYRVMVENINEGAITLDRSGIVVFSNKTFADLAGREMPAIVGLPFRTFLQPQWHEAFGVFLKKCAFTPCRAEFSLAGLQGMTIPVSISGTSFTAGGQQNICLIITDLTEQKVAVRQLRQAYDAVEKKVVERTRELRDKEEEFRTLCENSPDSIARLDINLRHLYVNPVAKKISGMDITGKTWREAGLPEEFVTFWENLFNKAIQTGKGEKIYSDYQYPDGATVNLSSGIVPEFDAQGKVRSVLIVTRDITERKRAEESLRRHAAELAATNESLEAFAHSIAHDLRNPIHSIVACSEVVKESLPPEDKDARKALSFITGSANRMSQIITDLLSLSNVTIQAMNITKCNLSVLAQSVAEELRSRDSGRETAITIEPELYTDGDEGLLRILMENLLNNAWKFTSKKQDTRIEIGKKNNGEQSPVYYVRDNGAGFEKAHSDRLFKPFQRLHSQMEYEGTGIGLTLVKRIVEKHGGRVWAEGEKDKGATIYFEIPSLLHKENN